MLKIKKIFLLFFICTSILMGSCVSTYDNPSYENCISKSKIIYYKNFSRIYTAEDNGMSLECMDIMISKWKKDNPDKEITNVHIEHFSPSSFYIFYY